MVPSTSKDPARASLRPMSEDEFEAWKAGSIEGYAGEAAQALGTPIEEARRTAHAQYAELLPDGLRSKGMSLWKVLDGDGTAAGTLWIGPHPRRAGAAFVFEIEIEPAHRRRGLGRAAMLLAEQEVAASGRTDLGLSVFGFNDGARRLYDSLGYRVVATQMAKTLTPEDS